MIEKGICMADGKTGAIILAAGRSAHMEELKPMLRMGQTTMIQREIDTIRQAGISPIVVVTGYQADVLERHISHRGAVCIRNKRYETSQMYGSICMGLRHIQKKADRVLLFPADVPMITADTIEKMAQAPGSMAVPVCQGKKGHPVMLSKEVFGHILTYRGGKGLRGAMDAWGEGVREIEVEDPGVLLDTNTKMDYESLLAYEKDRQKRGELAFQASISLSREEECFSALTADFLEAVAESGSMLGACQIRDISYSKGWKMLKIAEAQLGIQFLERQTGGSKGGFSVLTPEGKSFWSRKKRKRRIQMEEKLTHFDEKGNAIMVDVTEKKITSRTATASGKIHVNEAVMKAVLEGTVAKGDVLGVARVAGIMAVKPTAHLSPMCHTLLITKCSVDFEVDEKELTIKALCTAKLEGKTGVEMEALTGVSVALLTIYDMCKAIDKRMEIGEIHLDAKSGGKSGEFVR